MNDICFRIAVLEAAIKHAKKQALHATRREVACFFVECTYVDLKKKRLYGRAHQVHLLSRQMDSAELLSTLLENLKAERDAQAVPPPCNTGVRSSVDDNSQAGEVSVHGDVLAFYMQGSALGNEYGKTINE